MSLHNFNNWTGNLKEQDEKHPVLFIGHGSPMNGIEDNDFSRTWAKIAGDNPAEGCVGNFGPLAYQGYTHYSYGRT